MKLQCNMTDDCPNDVTHVGEKGFIYCAEHAAVRRDGGRERCRRVRRWELDLLRQGEPLPSYKPISKHVALPGVERFIKAATKHGEYADPDHEVGDLQEYFRIAWGFMTPEQRRRFAADARVGELLECSK